MVIDGDWMIERTDIYMNVTCSLLSSYFGLLCLTLLCPALLYTLKLIDTFGSLLFDSLLLELATPAYLGRFMFL